MAGKTGFEATQGVFKCPHCGDYGITAWRVMWLGPALPTRCRDCGGRVAISTRMLWWYAPSAILAAVAVQLESGPAAAAVMFVSMLLASWVALTRTRLIAREQVDGPRDGDP